MYHPYYRATVEVTHSKFLFGRDFIQTRGWFVTSWARLIKFSSCLGGFRYVRSCGVIRHSLLADSCTALVFNVVIIRFISIVLHLQWGAYSIYCLKRILLCLESGAYEPPKAAKERATTIPRYVIRPGAIKIQIQPQYLWKVLVYWNWLLPTYTDSHAQFCVWICISMARKLHAPSLLSAAHMLLLESINHNLSSTAHGRVDTWMDGYSINVLIKNISWLKPKPKSSTPTLGRMCLIIIDHRPPPPTKINISKSSRVIIMQCINCIKLRLLRS